MAYFERLSATSFRPTEHVGGAWNTEEQHIAPALGLMAHAVELDRDQRRDDGLVISRLSYDILGVLPMEPVDVQVRVVRPGRTIDLVEAVLSHASRPAVLLRAWLLKPTDTTSLAGTDLPRIPGPDELPEWDAAAVWPGGFIASGEIRRKEAGPGRASFWVRSEHALLDGEPVSATASAARLLDIANGMAVRADPGQVVFPNVDLTAHLVRQPAAGWVGFDTTVSFGPAGVGLTSSMLHDERGPFGTLAQSLTVRPLAR
ncbi:MAG: thioesterase family protein [Actinomycetales bacterium]